MVTGSIRDPLKQDLAREFCRKKSKKDIIILTETHINHDNWLGFIFFSPGVVTQNDCLSCFIWVLKVSLRLTLIQKGGLCPLRGLPLTTEFSVFNPLQGTRELLARERFFVGVQN